jgi:cytochrome c biogenesis protein CcdA
MTATVQPTGQFVPAAERGRAWWAYSAYVVFALGIALVFVTAYVIITAPGSFSVDLPGALLGIAVFLMGLAILDRLPRHVEVGPDAVKFRYLLSHVNLKWDQLAAPTLVGKGFVAFRAVTGARGVWGPLTVTSGQARAILSHPACPAFNVPADVAEELRLT